MWRGLRSSSALGGLLLALVLLFDAATVYFILRIGARDAGNVQSAASDILHSVFLGGIGYLVASRRARLAIGWLMIAVALAVALGYALREYWRDMAGAAPDLVLWAGWVLVNLGIQIELIVLSSFFPFGPQRSIARRVALVAQVAVVAVGSVRFFTPGPLTPSAFGIPNPLGLPALALLSTALAGAGNPAYAFLLLSAVALLVSRYVRGSPTVRQQIKWLAFALAIVAVAITIGYPIGGGQGWAVVPYHMAFAILPPAAIGVAILRYRLYDIDLIINRTLVYGAVTAILAGLYVAAVALVQRVLGAQGEAPDLTIVPLIFVLVAGASFLKDRLQRLVDRRLRPQSAPPTSQLDDLRMLAELHKRGVLTDAEYAAKTTEIVASHSASGT